MTSPLLRPDGKPWGPQDVNNLHRADDVDKDTLSHHHTLGVRKTQAAPGDHLHDGIYLPVGTVFGTKLVPEVTETASNSSSVSAETVIHSDAFTCDGVHSIQIDIDWYNIVGTGTAANDTFFISVYDGASAGSGTKLKEQLLVFASSTNLGGGHLTAFQTIPSAGLHTYTIRILRNSGTGTILVAAASGRALAMKIQHLEAA